MIHLLVSGLIKCLCIRNHNYNFSSDELSLHVFIAYMLKETNPIVTKPVHGTKFILW